MMGLARLRREYVSQVVPSCKPLLAVVSAGNPDADLRTVHVAYEVAVRWHAGQKRYSGHPYVTHPLEVAMIVASLGLRPAAVCAALLHDLVEDTPYTVALMRAEFGEDVTWLVEGVGSEARLHQAIDVVSGLGWNATTAVPEVELLVIKLADRLHNMRTIRHVSPAKQIHRSRQTLELVAPVAHHLGLIELKRELEDLSLGVLRPSPAAARRRGIPLRILDTCSLLLPSDARTRWREEWAAEVGTLRTPRQRVRFAIQTFAGVPRLALTLRRGSRHRDAPAWAVSLASIARALGVGGVIVAAVAPAEVVAWITGLVAVAALGLLTALLFTPSDKPSSRLADLIRAWRR